MNHEDSNNLCEALSMNEENMVKEELFDDEDISINPLENVKVEYDDEDDEEDCPESVAALDPLANVEVEYAQTAETTLSEPKSRKTKDPVSIDHEVESRMDIKEALHKAMADDQFRQSLFEEGYSSQEKCYMSRTPALGPTSLNSGLASAKSCSVKAVRGDGYTLVEIIPTSRKLKAAGRKLGRQFLRQYVCDQCQFTTKFKTTIVAHTLCHKVRYKCNQCSYETMSSAELLNHTKREHPDSRIFICDQCDFKTNKKYSLVRHVDQLHTEIKIVTCTVCSFKTTCRNYLVRHMKVNHNVNIETIDCNQCNQVFETKKERKEHIRYVHGDNTGKIFCDLCNFSCKPTYEMARHKQKKHLNSIIEAVNSDLLI